MEHFATTHVFTVAMVHDVAANAYEECDNVYGCPVKGETSVPITTSGTSK